MMTTLRFAAPALALCLAGTCAIAAPASDIGGRDPGLSGTVQRDTWDEITREKLKLPGTGEYFGQLDPAGPQDPYDPNATVLDYIYSQNRVNGAQLHRLAGNGYVASLGLYDKAAGGLGLDISFSDPLLSYLMTGTLTQEYLDSRTDLGQQTFLDPFQLQVRGDALAEAETLVFQIQIFGMAINDGYVTPFEMTEQFFPVTLTLDGVTTLLPEYKLLVDTSNYAGGGGADEAEAAETWAFQWDLRGLEFDFYSIDFTVYPHSSVRGLSVDQSTVFTEAYAVPEPSTWLLMGAASALVFLRRRRWA